MPLLAQDCLDEAASVYLNDPTKLRWGYQVLLPYLRSAALEMQAEFEANGLPGLDELSAVLTVNPGTVQLVTPSDMVIPLKLEERAPGEKRWNLVDEASWEPDADIDDKLNSWTFREGLIQFLGANTVREVRLKYVRSLSTIGSEASAIEVPNAKGYLAARTAGLASTFGGHATARGGAANERANYFMERMIQGLVHREQGKPIRRRRYPWRQLSRK